MLGDRGDGGYVTLGSRDITPVPLSPSKCDTLPDAVLPAWRNGSAAVL